MHSTVCGQSVPRPWRNLGKTSIPDLISRPSKGRAVTDPIWRHAVSAKARKQSQFGWILHSFMSAWSTTCSKPTRILLLPVTCPSSCRFSLQNATCVGTSWRGSRHWTTLRGSGVSLDVFIDDSPRKPRNTCMSSVLQTKRQRSSRPIRNWP